MRRRRSCLVVLAILALVAGLVVYAAWPGRSTFTVSPETTYVTGPLDKHGYVDYVTALNERLSQGIKPEDNANVLIWQALGPHPEGGTMPPEYFQWLGIESPPEEGEYLVSWQNYLKIQGIIPEPEPFQPDEKQNEDLFLSPGNLSWVRRHEAQLCEWLKQNEKPLALIVQATRRPLYYNPLVPSRTDDWSPGLMAALVPTVQRCRELAAALACRAMLRVNEGKIDEAWQDLLACHRLSRLLARGGSLIEMLVGIAIEQIAHTSDIAFLDHAMLSAQRILACWEDLEKLSPMPAVADDVDLTERFSTLETIMSIARHGPQALKDLGTPNSRRPSWDHFGGRLFTRSIDWDPALRNVNSWYDRLVSALRIPDVDTRTQEMGAITQDLKILKQQVTGIGDLEKALMGPESRGEWIGNIIIALLLPAIDRLQTAADRCEQAQVNLHLAFALAAYHRDNGNYPPKLEELVPKYMPAIPVDLFSDKPLIYRLEGKGYLLYSVGPNGKDDGGLFYTDDPPGDDIGIRVPAPEPKRTK